jgi:hypothetical protein
MYIFYFFDQTRTPVRLSENVRRIVHLFIPLNENIGDWVKPIAMPLIVHAVVPYHKECRTQVSFERLCRTFAFHSMYDGLPMHPTDIWPKGPNMIVHVKKASDVLSDSVRLTMAQLRSMIDGHGIFVGNKCSKLAMSQLISNHVCTVMCPQISIILRPLKRARKVVKMVGNENVTQSKRITMSTKAKGKRRAFDVGTAPDIENAEEYCDHLRAFPHIASHNEKMDIIREWQNLMDMDALSRHACAVCSQSIARRDVLYVLPAQIDFTLLRNECLPRSSLPTTYNLNAYAGAILNPKNLHNKSEQGVVERCTSCYATLLGRKKQPLDSIANFQYYGHEELPTEMKSALSSASIFDLMMVSRARASRLTHLFSKNKNSPVYGTDSAESQRYCQGNIAILPQDSLCLRNVLPPDHKEIKSCMCALFLGSDVVPTRENIKNLHPIMVTKDKVSTIIHFLLEHNSWYRASKIQFSAANLEALYDKSDIVHGSTGVIPAAVDLCHRPSRANENEPSQRSNLDRYAERDTAFENGSGNKIAMEAVGYTTRDYTPQNYCMMKATALAWCLDGNSFITSNSSSELMCDYDPGLMNFLFPSLDPWGIGDFCESKRQPDQYISFERQVKNLLKQYDSPFRRDPNFAYICWNIIQKHAVTRQATFRTETNTRKNIVDEINEAAPELSNMVQKWEANPHAKPSNKSEKKSVQMLDKLKLVAKEVRGSSGYKQCR